MKKQIATGFLLLVGALWLGANTTSFAQIEGLWRGDRLNVSIEIEETRNGINVRRTDQRQWYFYEYYGNGEYRNRDGSTYTFYSDNRLTFNNGRKRQQIEFSRDKFRNRGRDDFRGNDRRRNDDFFEEEYYYGNNRGNRRNRVRMNYNSAARLLDGRWFNNQSNTRIRIDRRGPNLRVRINGITRIYCPNRNGYFSDPFGNHIKLIGPQRLIFESNRFRRPVVFFQDGFNGRGRW